MVQRLLWRKVVVLGGAPNFRASSPDGTFGNNLTGADTTIGVDAAGHKYGFRATNTAATTLDFTVTDTTGVARELDWFSFDSVQRNGSAAGTYTLSVLSGDLTPGDVSSGAIAFGFDSNVLGDTDVSFAGLADNVLDANGTVTFRLSFTSTAVKSLDLDNVGVSAVPEPATLGMIAIFGGGLLFIRRRFMI